MSCIALLGALAAWGILGGIFSTYSTYTYRTLTVSKGCRCIFVQLHECIHTKYIVKQVTRASHFRVYRSRRYLPTQITNAPNQLGPESRTFSTCSHSRILECQEATEWLGTGSIEVTLNLSSPDIESTLLVKSPAVTLSATSGRTGSWMLSRLWSVCASSVDRHSTNLDEPALPIRDLDDFARDLLTIKVESRPSYRHTFFLQRETILSH